MHSIPWRRSKFMAKKKKHKPKKKQKKNARARRRFVESRGPPKEQERKKERKGRKFFFCFFLFFLWEKRWRRWRWTAAIDHRRVGAPVPHSRRGHCFCYRVFLFFILFCLLLLLLLLLLWFPFVPFCLFFFTWVDLDAVVVCVVVCRVLLVLPSFFFVLNILFYLSDLVFTWSFILVSRPCLPSFFFGFRPFFFLNRVSSARLCSCEIVFLYRVWFLFSFAQRSKYGNISRWFA